MSIIFSLGRFLACCAIFGIAELSLAQQAQPLFTIERPKQRCPHPEGQFSLEEVHQIQHIIQRLIERLAMLAHHIQNKTYTVERGPGGSQEVQEWIAATQRALRTTRDSLPEQRDKLYFTLYDLNFFIGYVAEMMRHSFIEAPLITSPSCKSSIALLHETNDKMDQFEDQFDDIISELMHLTASQKFFRLLDSALNSLKTYMPPLLSAVVPLALYRLYHENPAQIKGIAARLHGRTPLLEWSPAGFISLAGITYFTLDMLRFLLDNLLTVPKTIINQFGIARPWDNLVEWLHASWLSLQRKVPPPEKYKVIEDVTFDDPATIGFEEQKKQLSDVVEYLTNPEMFDLRHQTPNKLILFSGPPKTGKSLIARALAGTINKNYKIAHDNTRLRFIEVKLADLLSETGLLEAYKEAKFYEPSILYIDDLHLYEPKKGKAIFRNFQHIEDELKNYPSIHVFIIGSTVEALRVDDDLRNLFTKEISFTLPNYKQRYLFFKREITDKYKLTLDEIHVKSFAQQTEGLNYAQLEEIIRNALRKIERKTLNERIQEQINLLTHAIIGDCDLPQDHQKLIAAYLAGQVLVHHVLKSPFEFEFVTLGKLSIKEKDDNKCGKIVKFGPSQERESINIEGHKKLAQVLFAGPLAEDILVHDSIAAYHVDDEKRALEHAKIYFDALKRKCTNSHDDQRTSDQCSLFSKSQEKLDTMINMLKAETKQLLLNHKSTLALLASALQEKKVLTARDIKTLIPK